MGLVLSGITLSLNMVSIEYLKRHRLHNEIEFQQSFPIHMDSVTALRYVDDLLVISSALCGDCLKAYISTLYPWKISFSSCSTHDGKDHYHRWLDYVVGFRGSYCRLNKTNPNNAWIWSNGPRERFSILPWCAKEHADMQKDVKPRPKQLARTRRGGWSPFLDFQPMPEKKKQFVKPKI